ncbi:MAG: hypothetical protein A2V77_10850 [Anaeromyxobacter sp. RBG_16_69_14]|nr:MAG: hypothetical protein A2V77_10850 [Anaeromyxobacter sp. RBG_16_69_14]
MSRLSALPGCSKLADPTAAIRELRATIDQPEMKVVLFFCSSSYDLKGLGSAIQDAFPCPVVGCTSSGQIGPTGYQRGGITAVSLASDDLVAHPYLISPLSECRERAAQVGMRVRTKLEDLPPGKRAFGLILVDGLSQAEEALAATLYQSLGNVPIVGGSAGDDDLKFERTSVYWEGEFLSGAALFTLFETSRPFSAFKLQNFGPTDKKLVVTAADPERRVVKEFNGLPAAEAFAELLGLSLDQLDSNVFSSNPVMLRIGSDDYVRSIQKVNPDLSVTLYCAIDEGLVLTIGKSMEPLTTLAKGFRDATRDIGTPSLVIGCDCVLRRLDFEQGHLDGQAGDFLARNKVIGFSTYGEQFNAVHVNQTFTGIALGE